MAERIADLTNRELFRKALEKVKALNGTAQAKADLFEQEAQVIERLTNGAWSAQRMTGTNGEHVFIGRVGDLLVIGQNGQLHRGRLQDQQFIPPDQVQLDYGSLHAIN